jgi:hypothetical protein
MKVLRGRVQSEIREHRSQGQTLYCLVAGDNSGWGSVLGMKVLTGRDSREGSAHT